MPTRAPDMRRAGLTSPKLYTLAAELGISRAEAIGHLELLWDYTKDHAIQGNIGKWPNGAIARAADWLEDPDRFIAGLVKSGFLDPHPTHRLLVHDWHDHVDRWVKASLEKQGLGFLTVPSVVQSNLDLSATTVATTVPTSSLPSTSLASTSLDKTVRGRATALPPDFDLTDDQVAYAKSKGIQDVSRELEAFKAHHQAHGKTMKSWPAAWRTWCLNFQKFGGRSSGEKPRKLSAVERVVQATRKRDAEIDAAAGQDGQRALETDGGDLRPPLDQPVWRD